LHRRFPGETEAGFETLLEFIANKVRALACSLYSQEEQTIAGRMAGQIPRQNQGSVAAELAMAETTQSSTGISASFVGTHDQSAGRATSQCSGIEGRGRQFMGARLIREPTSALRNSKPVSDRAWASGRAGH